MDRPAAPAEPVPAEPPGSDSTEYPISRRRAMSRRTVRSVTSIRAAGSAADQDGREASSETTWSRREDVPVTPVGAGERRAPRGRDAGG